MNREIKFRGWNGKEMIYYPSWFTLDRNNVLCFSTPPHNYVDDSDIDYPSRITLSQYTGLLDKNGKEIYEGDIVQHWVTDYDVCAGWKDDDVRWETPLPLEIKTTDYVTLENFGYWLKNEHFGFEAEELVQPSDCVIIGNIYEHPHLLKNSADETN